MTEHSPDPDSIIATLWRTIDQQGWSHRPAHLIFGWRVARENDVPLLRSTIQSITGYSPAKQEAYEPEDDPLEFIVCSAPRVYSRDDLEAEVRWAGDVGARLGATLTRAGVQIIDDRAA